MGAGEECNAILHILVRKDVLLFCIWQRSEWSIGVKRAGMGRAFQAEGRASGDTLKIYYYVFFFFSDFPIWAVP